MEDEDVLAIEDEVYQRAVKPQLNEGAEKDFKPWHKPRKHYLRVYQWCSQIATLIKDLGLREGDPLRYLGMPGEDLLDVRTLQGVCERSRIKLLYLGFDSTADTKGQYELNLSKHEVAALGFMDPFSKILKDRVEGIAKDKSITQSRFEEMAPYDVINLDLCDSVAESTGPGSYYDALMRICDLQLKAGRSKPWLLFLATRAIRTQIDGNSRVQLLQCIRANMSASQVFTERVEKRLSLSVQDIDDEIANIQELEHVRLVRAFGLGFAKWLLKMCMSRQPMVKVELLQSFSYRIEVAEPDMLSLGFRFVPIIESRVDDWGLARASSPVALPTEEALGIALAEAMGGVTDVDQLLADNPALMTKVIEQSAKVLEGARYPRQKYLDWVKAAPTYGDPAREDGGRVMTSKPA